MSKTTYEITSTRKLKMDTLKEDDAAREEIAGRTCDFSGSDGSTRDIGWEGMTQKVAIELAANLVTAFPAERVRVEEVEDDE